VVKAVLCEQIKKPKGAGDGVWLCGYGYSEVESDKVQFRTDPRPLTFLSTQNGPVEYSKEDKAGFFKESGEEVSNDLPLSPSHPFPVRQRRLSYLSYAVN
jgi:hypothetical protein